MRNRIRFASLLLLLTLGVVFSGSAQAGQPLTGTATVLSLTENTRTDFQAGTTTYDFMVLVCAIETNTCFTREVAATTLLTDNNSQTITKITAAIVADAASQNVTVANQRVLIPQYQRGQ